MTDRQFRLIWNNCQSVEEASEAVGCSVVAARNRAEGLRTKGNSLKRLGSRNANRRKSTRPSPPDFDPSNFSDSDFDELVASFSSPFAESGLAEPLDRALTEEVYRRAAALRAKRVGKIPEDVSDPVEICEVASSAIFGSYGKGF